jgi:hypothetical protein
MIEVGTREELPKAINDRTAIASTPSNLAMLTSPGNTMARPIRIGRLIDDNSLV